MLVRDERGATVVTYALLLPILILLILGTFEVWKVISIKQSLNAGTYKAARYLSANNDRWQADRERAKEIIWRELENNGLLGDDVRELVEIYIPTHRPACDALFSVKAELELPWATVIPYLPSRNMVLVEQHTSYIECTTYWTPPEKHAY